MERWVALLILGFGLVGRAEGSASLAITAPMDELATAQVRQWLEVPADFVVPIETKADLVHDGFFETGKIFLRPELTSVELKLTLLHEFVHALRHSASPNEDRWLQEGLAKTAEVMFSGVWSTSYEERLKTNPLLRITNDVSAYAPFGEGYVGAFFLTFYLQQHLGGREFLLRVIKSPLTGWDAVLGVAREMKAERKIFLPADYFEKSFLIRQFMASLALNDVYAGPFALLQYYPRFQALASAPLISFVDETESIEPQCFEILSRSPFRYGPCKGLSKGFARISIQSDAPPDNK